MKTLHTAAILGSSLCVTAAAMSATAAQRLNLDFDNGADRWRVVVDGVMGGLSTGRVTQPQQGILRFSGDLSLENNGGFSQIRRTMNGDSFVGAAGIELRVRGDGRVYSFDVRTSNARLMAGAFQREFLADDSGWNTIRIPFEEFRLYNFGRLVPNPPALSPALIESIGITLGDKKTGPFAMEVDSIRAYGTDIAPAQSSGNDLATVASNAGLTTLLELMAAAELKLPQDQTVTVFAPTNDAFAKLPRKTVQQLLEPANRDTLRSILSYHIVLNDLSSRDVMTRRYLDTMNGQRLVVSSNGQIAIGDARVLAVDVPFDGGVVHVIDTVLMPELNTLLKLVESSDNLSTLAAAVSAAQLGDSLGPDNGPFTVFAPLNSAFAGLPKKDLESLLQPEQREALIRVLGLHIVPGRLYSNDFLVNESASTFLGETVGFSVVNGVIQVNDAAILTPDIEASNGVVHLIDTVLLPYSAPEQSTGSTVSSAAVRARAKDVFSLAIRRGVPLFNNDQPAACAAVYEVAIMSLLSLGADQLDPAVTTLLNRSLDDAAQEDARERAWIYRRAMDEVLAIWSSR